MSNFWLRQLSEFDPGSEQVEEALERVITTTNKNVEQLKHMLWGNISSANVREIDADIVTVTNLVIGTNVDQGFVPQIFNSTPVPPYKINDVWLNGTDLKRCIVAKDEGEAYHVDDWALGTNYQNPTGVTSIVGGVVTTDYVNALAVIAGSVKAENITTVTAKITTAQIDALIVGTNVGEGTVPKIFYTEPTTPYKVNDIWISGVDLKRCKTAKETGVYDAADWELGTNYQNPTGVTSIVGGVVTTDYVNALAVIAGSVAAENITGTTITGKTIRTAASGTRLELSTDTTLYGYSGVSLMGTLSIWSSGMFLNTNSSSNTLSLQAGTGYTALTGGGIYLGASSANISIFSAYNEIALTAGSITAGGKRVARADDTVANHSNTASHDHGGATGSTGANHNHGITPGHSVWTKNPDTSVESWVVWAASGGFAHTHTITNFAGQTHQHTI